MKFRDTDTFWGRVAAKCMEYGISSKELAERVGLAYSTVRNLTYTGDLPKKAGVIDEMARQLGTTRAYLLTGGEELDMNSYPPDVREVIHHYMFLSEERKAEARAILQVLNDRQADEDFKRNEEENRKIDLK